MEKIIIYTDGACRDNQDKINRRGGYGVFFGDNDKRNKSIKLTGDKITNQVAELTACICAVETFINNNDKILPIIIKTDSMYTINCITKWYNSWENNKWKKSDGKPVDNLELIKKLHNYYRIYDIEFIHIKAHKKEPKKTDNNYNDWYGNMMADKLATEGADII
jgi:ribonuclease HI